MFVEEVGDLHLTDKRDDSHAVIAVIHQSHLVLKITDILFEALPRLVLMVRS